MVALLPLSHRSTLVRLRNKSRTLPGWPPHRQKATATYSHPLLAMAAEDSSLSPVPQGSAPNPSVGPKETVFTENTSSIILPTNRVAFLNPVQEFNRDLSIFAIRTWSEILNEEKKRKWEAKKRKNAKGPGTKDQKPAGELDEAGESGALPGENGSVGESAGRANEGSVEPEAKRRKLDTVAAEMATSSPREPTLRPYRFTLLEALSATGLRSIRYAKEIPLLRWVLANDLSESAVKAMRRNIALNFPEAEEQHEVEPEAKAEEGNGADVEMETMKEAAGEGAPVDNPDVQHQLEQPRTKDKGKGRNLPGEAAGGKVRVNHGDACALMYQHRVGTARFDVVDLDPYGTAAPFLDAALQSVSDGGLLCVTCTDLAVLAGHNYPEKCYANYGGVSLKAEYSHEMALRLVLHAISTSAARYSRHIVPLLSLSIDFYVRIFVRVYSSPVEVKRLYSKTATVYTCHHCQNFHLQPLGRVSESKNEVKGTVNFKYHSAQGPPAVGMDGKCEECGSTMHVAGPMWAGPLHDRAFVAKMLDNLERAEREGKTYGTKLRMKGMLNTAMEEIDAPFYFTPGKVAGLFHCVCPPLPVVASGLLNAGYKLSRSHASAGSLKTDATRPEIFDLMRCWIKQHPVRVDKIKEGAPAKKMLEKGIMKEFDLDTAHPEAERLAERRNLVRYQENPQPNWGPGQRARG